MKRNKKKKNTYDREAQDPKFRKLFEKEYKDLLLSELILALMAED